MIYALVIEGLIDYWASLYFQGCLDEIEFMAGKESL